ncbi:MAG TPA: creatininase family protein [Vicinamibacterales bacterium]|nr:creatininase family protein [Vicinamibacterales bacterium]
MNRTAIALIVWLIGGPAALAQEHASRSRIYRLEELTAPQIDALDRAKTLFILPVGMIEVHGPHLPVGTDTLGLIYEAHAASRQVSGALPDWNIVMMPPINYGQSGANELGGRLVHPGTYAIRQSTLRSVVADLGAQLAQNRFKWIFVLNGHGAPTHNIAINEACDFVSETFRVTMLHITGLLRADRAIQSNGQRINSEYFSATELSSFGMDIHAGIGETSGMLAIRPDLVSTQYKTLPRQVGQSLGELRDIAAAPGWQGYVSDPARASAAHGRAVEAWWIGGFAELIVRAVRGEDMFVHPRFPDVVPIEMAPIAEKALANEAAFEATLAKWLSQRRQR